MGFLSTMGRALFAAYFLFSAYLEFSAFGVDGGPLAWSFRSTLKLHSEYLTSNFGVKLPDFQIEHVIAACIALRMVGGILLVLGSNFGAFLLLLHLVIAAPFSYNFYSQGKRGFVQNVVNFTQDLALVGALLFFLGMKRSITIRQSRKKHAKSKTG